jgi:ATP-binding cassette subfamily C protein CydD
MKIDTRIFLSIKYIPFYLGAIGLLSILSGSLIVGQANFLARIIDRVFLGHEALTQVWVALGSLLLIMILRAGLIWGNELIGNWMASAAKTLLRQRIFAHLLRLGPGYMKGERSGELVNTATEGVEALDAYFSQVLPQICATIVIPIIILIFVFLTDTLSGVVLLITLPLLPIFMILIGKQANAATQRRWHLLNRLSAHFLDVLQGSTTLKLFGRGRAQLETIQRVSERYGDTTMQVLRIAFLSALVMEIGATISTAIIAVEIGLRLLYGMIPFEPAFFVLLLTPEYYQPLRALGPQFHASMESAAGAQSIFDILETPIPQAATASSNFSTPNSAIPAEGLWELEFRDVHYTYPTIAQETQPALRGVSFRAHRGQTIAIVGASGAGKSTLAHLLLRFAEPERGEILANGKPICTLPAQRWRAQVAWQPQRPHLFYGTVAENIRLAKSDASQDEIKWAAQQAGLTDVIEALPQQYETPIGERGMRLSGGEAQRLSLARAFLKAKQAPLLLLDEATSTVDSDVEARIFQALAEIQPEHIILVIAHRLHTIQQADQILVMQKGRVVASGSHEELRQCAPIYQELLRAYASEEANR